jgi:GNAT superfamily N-acetyltransferase
MSDIVPVPIVAEGAQISLDDSMHISFVCITRNVITSSNDAKAVVASVHAIPDNLLAVGSIKWHIDSDGEIGGISVHSDWRRRGIAKLLWKMANELSIANNWPPPRHSAHRTALGDEFAKAVGGSLPELAEGRLADDSDDGFPKANPCENLRP